MTSRRPTTSPVFPDLSVRVNGQPVTVDRLGPTHVTIPRSAVLGFLTLSAMTGLVFAYIGLKDAYATLGGPGTQGGTVLTIAIGVAVAAVLAVLTYMAILIRRTHTNRKTPRC